MNLTATDNAFQTDTELTKMLGIEFPIIMAPMFLVSNTAMVIEAAKNGITGAIPALNYRTDEAFRKALQEIRDAVPGKPFGINLIVNKSNIRMSEQLQACVDYKVDYIITSLGSPETVIKACKPHGMKVFCDVVDLAYAKKVEEMGADALIAVNNEAGGHAGKLNPIEIIQILKANTKLPVISAGGVGDGAGIAAMLKAGACGVSMGSVFIASTEAPVSDGYKQACVQFGAKDIVMTTRLSGTPCTVINTDYVKQTGTQQNWMERLLNSNKQLKKYAKMLTFYKGMKLLEKAAFSATYQTMWCAGPSIEHVTKVEPVAQIVQRLKSQTAASLKA